MRFVALLDNARTRARSSQLDFDCRASTMKWLHAIAKATDREDHQLASWVLTDDGAALRERWIRRLRDVIDTATGPVWTHINAMAKEEANVDALRAFALEGRRLVEDVLKSPAMLPRYRERAWESIAELEDTPSPHLDLATMTRWYGGPFDVDELEVLPMWRWLGAYLSPPLPE